MCNTHQSYDILDKLRHATSVRWIKQTMVPWRFQRAHAKRRLLINSIIVWWCLSLLSPLNCRGVASKVDIEIWTCSISENEVMPLKGHCSMVHLSLRRYEGRSKGCDGKLVIIGAWQGRVRLTMIIYCSLRGGAEHLTGNMIIIWMNIWSLLR